MQIIIAGGGKIGAHLASQLCADGETVTMDFVIYGDGNDEVEGTLEIRIGDVNASSGGSGDIRYYMDYSSRPRFLLSSPIL